MGNTVTVEQPDTVAQDLDDGHRCTIAMVSFRTRKRSLPCGHHATFIMLCSHCMATQGYSCTPHMQGSIDQTQRLIEQGYATGFSTQCCHSFGTLEELTHFIPLP